MFLLQIKESISAELENDLDGNRGDYKKVYQNNHERGLLRKVQNVFLSNIDVFIIVILKMEYFSPNDVKKQLVKNGLRSLNEFDNKYVIYIIKRNIIPPLIEEQFLKKISSNCYKWMFEPSALDHLDNLKDDYSFRVVHDQEYEEIQSPNHNNCKYIGKITVQDDMFNEITAYGASNYSPEKAKNKAAIKMLEKLSLDCDDQEVQNQAKQCYDECLNEDLIYRLNDSVEMESEFVEYKKVCTINAMKKRIKSHYLQIITSFINREILSFEYQEEKKYRKLVFGVDDSCVVTGVKYNGEYNEAVDDIFKYISSFSEKTSPSLSLYGIMYKPHRLSNNRLVFEVKVPPFSEKKELCSIISNQGNMYYIRDGSTTRKAKNQEIIQISNNNNNNNNN